MLNLSTGANSSTIIRKYFLDLFIYFFGRRVAIFWKGNFHNIELKMRCLGCSINLIFFIRGYKNFFRVPKWWFFSFILFSFTIYFFVMSESQTIFEIAYLVQKLRRCKVGGLQTNEFFSGGGVPAGRAHSNRATRLVLQWSATCCLVSLKPNSTVLELDV